MKNNILFIGVPVICAVLTDGALLYSSGWNFQFSGFFVWPLVPYLLLIIPPLIRKSQRKFSLCYLSLISITAVTGPFLYFHSLFVARPDAQGALVFLFVPIYQVIAGVILGVWYLISTRHKLAPNKSLNRTLPCPPSAGKSGNAG